MKYGLLVLALLALLASFAEADPLAPTVDLAVCPRALERIPDGPTIVATKTGIVVDGKAIASISNGYVDPVDKEGGALGLRITRLAEFMKTLRTASKTPADDSHPRGVDRHSLVRGRLIR